MEEISGLRRKWAIIKEKIRVRTLQAAVGQLADSRWLEAAGFCGGEKAFIGSSCEAKRGKRAAKDETQRPAA